MLSREFIRKEAVKSGYYLKEDSGYYTEEGIQKTLYQWIGKGAKEQGLHGAINEAVFKRVFNGVLPSGDTIGRRDEDGNLTTGRNGYDLTFTMNKEISLIICCTKDKSLREYFLESHINAVKTAMAEVEKMVAARVTQNGVTSPDQTKNMIAALCTHLSSRKGDPNVHTHALVANATKRTDGKWRALSTEIDGDSCFFSKINDNATYFGHIYQNEMELATKAKGFKTRSLGKHGMFAIDGFSEDLKENFSKRRMDILAAVSKLPESQQNNKIVLGKVSVSTRDSKVTMKSVDFIKHSQGVIEKYFEQKEGGIAFDDHVSGCQSPNKEKDTIIGEHTREAIIDAVNALSTFYVSMDPSVIIERAMELDHGKSSFEATQKALESYIKEGGLLRSGSGHYTSKALIDRENKFMSSLEGLKPAGSFDNVKKESGNLQQGVITSLKRGQCCVVREPRDISDKTKQMDSLINRLEREGYKVSVLTQTKTIASEYNRSVKENESFFQRLTSLGKSDRAHSLHGFVHHYEEKTASSLSNVLAKKGKEVFIIEHANSLGLGMAEKMIDLSQRRGAKLVFMSYQEGRMSSMTGNVVSLLKKSGVPEVSVPLEKKPSKEIDYVVHEVKSDINADSKEKRLDRQERLAYDLLENHDAQFSKVQVLSANALGARTQTDCIRRELKERGLLGDDSHCIETERPVYLPPEKRKHVKYFKKGWIARTYVGKGCFQDKEILNINKKTNQLLMPGVLNRKKYMSPGQVLKNTDTRLYEKDSITISDQDRIKINSDNSASKRIGMSSNTGYIISIHGDKATLTPEKRGMKPIRTKIGRLKGLDLSYDYVKTINQDKSVRKTREKALLDTTASALDKNTLNELGRRYESVDIYTDNEARAVKRMGKQISPELASDLSFEGQEKVKDPAERAIDFSLSVVSSREAAFCKKSVLKKAFEHPQTSVPLVNLSRALDKRIASGELQQRELANGSEVIATQKVIDLENALISQIKQGKASVQPFMEKEKIDAALSATNLTEGQKEACSLIASSSDRFLMIQGYAGTGKSTMLERLKESLDATDTFKDNIIALAPTHQAVRELRNKGMAAQTLKSFLVDERGNAQESMGHLKDKLILLDESSMVSNRDFKELQDIVTKAGSCHCVYIGDVAQLQPVEAGIPSEIAYLSKEANIETATMDEVLRQKNPSLRGIAHALMQGDSSSAFKGLNQEGWVKASKDPIMAIANNYASLNEQDRRETLVAVATNANREKVNTHIRSALEEKGILTGEPMNMTMLKDSRLTNAELVQASSYHAGNVVKINQKYFDVIGVDHDSNSLKLSDSDNNPSHLSLNHMTDNKHIELFRKEVTTIKEGDTIKWTKTDKERNVLAHEQLTVIGMDRRKGILTVKNDQGSSLNIDTNKRMNQHVDYSYASTVHGLQGATSKSVMCLLDSSNRRSNNMRLMYVAMTRATDKALLYTDDLSKVSEQVAMKKGGESSALSRMGLLERREGIGEAANDQKHSADKESQPVQNTINREEDKKTFSRIDAKEVESGLKEQARHVCQSLFGEPNAALSNAYNWRYGKKGSLSVAVGGDHQGLFCNFETDEKGGMIQLIMSELGVGFKEALEQGSRMLGGEQMTPGAREVSRYDEKIPNPSEAEKQEAKKAYMDSLIDRSKPISQDMVKTYLEGRGIADWRSADLRVMEWVNTGGGNNKSRPHASALLAIAKDAEGNATAIQLTYLDPKTGEKLSDLPVPKRTIGSLQGSFVAINEAQEPGITFVAEGVETALSISQSLKEMGRPNEQVIASLGKSNLKQAGNVDTATHVVFVLDNDNQDWRSDKTIQAAIEAIETSGKKAHCIQPKSINGVKTDYNDLLQLGKSDEIQCDLEGVIKEIETEKDSPGKQRPAQKEINPIEVVSREDREMFG